LRTKYLLVFSCSTAPLQTPLRRGFFSPKFLKNWCHIGKSGYAALISYAFNRDPTHHATRVRVKNLSVGGCGRVELVSSRCGGPNPQVRLEFYTASLAEIEHIPICSIVNFFVEQPNGLCKPLFQNLFLLFFLRVQTKLLILFLFPALSIYLFFNKIYIQVSRSWNTLTFTLSPAFLAGKEVLRRRVFLHRTKEQVRDSPPNMLIYIVFLPFK